MEAPPLSSAKPEAEWSHDFGKSIGEILGQAPSSAISDAEGTDVGPTGKGERLPIEMALRLAKGEDEAQETKPPAFEEVPAEALPAESGHRSLTGPKLMLAGLFALVLIFSAAAVAGIIMFVRKNGLPDLGGFVSKVSLIRTPAAVPPSAPPEAAKTVNTVVLVSKEAASAGDMPNVVSRVVETDVKATKSFDATGTAPADKAKSSGTVTIVNTTARSYTFVATTRFLTKDGVLFRLVKATVIPANGNVSAAVAADKSGPQGDIGPASFSIPGLAANLQDKIYGQSETAMAGGSGTVPAVSADDLAKAKAAITADLQTESGKNLEAMLLDGEKVIKELGTSEELDSQAPAEGTKTASFTMMLSLRFRALVLPEKKLRLALLERLRVTDPTAGDADLGPLRYTVQAGPDAEQRAEVRLEADLVNK
ncbi:MAG: hypothetical protein AAB692_05855 [Patescibacteria group bacterium]